MRESGNLPRTQIKVKPEGSHAFVVTFAVIGGVCLLTGFGLLGFGSGLRAAVPIAIGLLLEVGAYVAWWHSHRDVDLKGGPATTIIDRQTGMQVTTDTRAITTPKSVRQLASLFRSLAHRQPLPEPDGFVDEEGAPVPEAKADAVAKVESINAQIESDTMQLIGAIAGVGDEVKVEQPLTLEQPPDETVMKLNKPAEDDE